MVEKLPSPHTYLLLGDAYINIQEVSGRCDSSVSYEIFLIPQQLICVDIVYLKMALKVLRASIKHFLVVCCLMPVLFWSSLLYIIQNS